MKVLLIILYNPVVRLTVTTAGFQKSRSEKNSVSVKVRHVGKTTTFLLQYLNNQERPALIYSTSSFNHVSSFYN